MTDKVMSTLLFIIAVIISGCSTDSQDNAAPHLALENTTEARVQAFLRSSAKYPETIIVEYCGGMRSSKNTTTKDAFCLFRGRDRSGSRVRIGTTFFFHEDGRITQLYGGGE